MTTKIGKTVHLSHGQWKVLKGLMQGDLQSSDDESVRRVCKIMLLICDSSGTVRGKPQ